MLKQRLLPIFVLVLVGALALGCESRTDKTETGGVEISVSDFDGLALRHDVSVDFLQVDELTLQNISKDPFAATSDLMNVELYSYEVTYTRADTGTRLPPPLVRGLFGTVPVNGTAVFNNLPVMDLEQFSTEPLSDLYPFNGGFDTETGNALIRLNFRLVFFGRTISGDEVRSGPANFTVEICNCPAIDTGN